MDYVPVKSESCDDQNEKNSTSNDQDEDSCIVRMRGLPWSVTSDDILSFLSDCQIKDIHLTTSSLGRPSGEAYVEFASAEDVLKALKKDHEHMGHRYIEVFRATRSEMDWVVSHSGMDLDSVMEEGCIRMRGLPYGCTKEDVSSFFSGLQIVPNGINFATDHNGHATGEAYVQFVNKENLEKALQKHMEIIGCRYIEIFRSSLAEVNAQTKPKMRFSASGFGRTGFGRMTPYNRSERFGGPNRFRGGGSAPFPRMSRRQNDDYWVGAVDGDAWDYGDGFVPRNNPLMRGGFRGTVDSEYGTLHRVHMRGLPYRATEVDISMFFSPLQPNNIRILYDQTNRPSGKATVTFASHNDAVEAMAKDKEHMQNRYIDLILDSEPKREEFDEQSGEGLLPHSSSFAPSEDLPYSSSFAPRSRGRAFRGGNRARAGGPVFGFNERTGHGRQPFMSGGGPRFRPAF